MQGSPTRSVDPGQNRSPSYPIESVDNALRLLLLVTERGRLRIADGARELGVARSTAHRLMQMLHYHRFVRQDAESKAYLPGPVLLSAGLEVVRSFDIRNFARAHLEGLVEEVGESAHLLSLHGSELVCLDSVESSRSVRVGSRTGMTLPVYASASGRVLLAEMSPERVDELFPRSAKKLNPNTITSRRQLEKEVALVHERGYAVQRGEIEADVAAVSAAVPDSRGEATFAITVSVPLSRMDDEDVPRIAAATVKCAREVSAALPW